MRVDLRRWLGTTCMMALVACVHSVDVSANPQGGNVAAGQASITSSGNHLDVTQRTNKAVIDWRGFDIAPNETTQFHQPSSNAITLNRVHSDAASQIEGNLTANGNLILINQNGVMFGNGAKVDVNGLVVSTADTTNNNFMNNKIFTLDSAGDADAFIINNGQITAKEAGLVGFVAPNVVNQGIITATLGKVQLASGDTATLDMYGDGLMQVAVSDAVKSQLVSNTGSIQANGGKIALTAAAGKAIVNSLINAQGSLQAQSVGMKNGEIVISAAGSNKTGKQGKSTVVVQGVLDASGRDKGERGGKITVTGDDVALLDGTLVDATGDSGKTNTTAGKKISDVREGSAGGDIRIGGDYLGQGSTPTAENLYVDKGVLILNDALSSGDAGRSIFWSDNTTQFYGNVYARALGGEAVDANTWNAISGGNAGMGGFVETSGHGHLDAGGYVDLTASSGARGTYFLDPTDITIYGNFAPTDISGLKLWLDASDQSSMFSDTAGTTQITNGGSVARWNDKSGNGNNATQSTAGSRPTWNSSGLNSKGTITYDGDDAMDFTPFAQSSQQSIFVTYQNPSSTYYEVLLNRTYANNGPAIYLSSSTDNASTLYWDGAGPLIITSAPVSTSAKIGYWGWNGTSYSIGDNNLINTVAAAKTNVDQWNGLGLNGYGQQFTGTLHDVIMYNTQLSTNNQALVNQYQSAKWGIALTPPGTGATENAKATASDGYSVFTTRYLERLSQSADVSLQATNNITLDLKGDTLNFSTANRSLSLTAGNQILVNTGGGIVTNGGNITLSSVGDLDVSALSFSTGGGDLSFSGRDVTFNTWISTSGTGSLTVNATRDIYLAKNDLTTGLTGYWKFDEGSGTSATDSSGNGNTGTLTNGPTYSTNTPFSSGYSLSFDGTNDYVDSGATSAWSFGTGNFTAGAWFKTTGSSRQSILNKFQYNGTGTVEQGFFIDMLAGGKIRVGFETDGGNNYRVTDSNATYNDGSWHYVAFTRSAQNTINLYVDGQFISSNTLTAGTVGSVTTTNPLRIGYEADYGVSPGFTTYFNGQIDDVRIYNSALSASDILNSMAPQVTWNVGAMNLTAANNIALDLKNSTFSLGSDKSLTLTATGGSISTSSMGGFTTSRSGTGGNITMSSGTDTDISNLTLTTGNGNLSLSGRDITFNTWINTGTGNVTVNAARDVTLANQDVTTGLVSYWKFDEGSGTSAADSSGNGNTGTLTNGPTWSSNTPSGTGYSLSFDGVNDYVDVGNLSNLSLGGANKVSLSLWGNWDSLASTIETLFSWQSGSTVALVLHTSIASEGVLAAAGGGYGEQLGVDINGWHNWTMVYDGTLSGDSNRLKLYLDGSQKTLNFAAAVPAVLPVINANAKIGTQDCCAGREWTGLIDDVRIYNTALSTSDITKLAIAHGLWNTGTTSITAANNITLDLKGDTLTLGSDKNLSLTATSGAISSSSIGGITTNRTGSGGNITMSAGGTASLSNLTLTATGGAVSLTSAGAMTTGAISGGSVSARTTGAATDLTLGGNITATNNSGSSIILAGGRDVVNSGSKTLTVTNPARWLIFSGDTANITWTNGGLTESFHRYGCTYNSGSPSCAAGTDTPATGNGVYYAYAPTLTLTGLSASNKTYDATTTAVLTGTAVLNGAINSDSLTLDASAASAAFANKNVGTGKTVTASGYALSGTNLGYVLTQPTFTANIIKANLTVTADNATRDEGAANPTFTASYAGFVGGETFATSGITGNPALATVANNSSAVGTYAITAALGSLAATNYHFNSFVDGVLTVAAVSSGGGSSGGGSTPSVITPPVITPPVVTPPVTVPPVVTPPVVVPPVVTIPETIKVIESTVPKITPMVYQYDLLASNILPNVVVSSRPTSLRDELQDLYHKDETTVPVIPNNGKTTLPNSPITLMDGILQIDDELRALLGL